MGWARALSFGIHHRWVASRREGNARLKSPGLRMSCACAAGIRPYLCVRKHDEAVPHPERVGGWRWGPPDPGRLDSGFNGLERIQLASIIYVYTQRLGGS
jgi:hypothetical protein